MLINLSKRRNIFLLGLIFLAILYIYFPLLKAPLVWDDEKIITQEINAVRNYSFFTRWGGKYYRPVVSLFFLLDQFMWHYNPLGYHLTNILLHFCNCVLLFVLAQLLWENKTVALMAGIFFALYPVHTESVSWIAGRTDLICGLFFLLSFINFVYYLKYKDKRAFLMAFLFAVFSAGAKEIGMTLFILCPLYAFLTEKRRIYLYSLFVFFILGIVYLYLRQSAITTIILPAIKHHGLTNSIFLAIKAYGFYMYKTLFPFRLNFFIGKLPDNILFNFFSIITMALILYLGIYAFFKRKTNLGLIIFWWLLTLAPAVCVVWGGLGATPVAERYLYIPSMGFCLFLGYIMQKAFLRKPKLVSVLVLAILLSFGWTTYKRHLIWTDNVKLWEDTVKKSPEFGLPRHWYGISLYKEGKVTEAIKQFKKTLNMPFFLGKEVSINEDKIKLYKAIVATGLGSIYSKTYFKTRPELAKEWYEKAIEYYPYYQAYYGLGVWYFERAKKIISHNKIIFDDKLLKKARHNFQMALKLNKKYQPAYYQMGIICWITADYPRAKKYFIKVIESNPGTELASHAAEWLEKIRKKTHKGIL